MIARCPRCQVRYKVAREEIGPRGSRLRCARCELVFRIEVPSDASASQQRSLDPDTPRVLLVEADETLAKRTSEFLRARGLRCEAVADGDVALLSLLRDPPRLVLVGTYAAGLEPRDLIEAVRLASDLREVRLVRIADAECALLPPGSESVQVLEPPDLPEGLAPVLEQLDLGPSPQEVSGPDRRVPSVAPARELTGVGLFEPRQQARQGTLPRAVVAHQTHTLAPANRERHPGEHTALAVGAVQVEGVDHRHATEGTRTPSR